MKGAALGDRQRAWKLARDGIVRFAASEVEARSGRQQGRGIGMSRIAEHLLDDRLTVLQNAQIERNRPWVNPGYAGHMIRP